MAESLYSVIVTAAVSRASSAEEEVHMIISCCTARWLALLSPCRGPCCPLCRMAVLVLSVIVVLRGYALGSVLVAVVTVDRFVGLQGAQDVSAFSPS